MIYRSTRPGRSLTRRGTWYSVTLSVALLGTTVGAPAAFCDQTATPPATNNPATSAPPATAVPPAAPTLPAPQTPPAAPNRYTPRPVEPAVNPDGTVAFSLTAPGAKDVQITGQAGNAPMTRDDKGTWRFTSAPLAPEIYDYQFVVDGLRITDPQNTYSRGMDASLIMVPARDGATPMPWEMTDVPHGAVTTTYYKSAAAGGAQRRVHVYLPPGYHPEKGDHYPTFYLLHGSGDDDASWVNVSRANLIFDNLIAQKRMKPMVVVMPYGFMPRGSARNAFDADLLENLLPYIEQNFRVQKGAAYRALGGLSMGGGQSFLIGMRHPGMFAYVATWSTGQLGSETVEALDAEFPDIARSGTAALPGMKQIYLSGGDADFRLPATKGLDNWLTVRKIPHEFHVKQGNHQWSVWRASLIDFSQELFP